MNLETDVYEFGHNSALACITRLDDHQLAFICALLASQNSLNPLKKQRHLCFICYLF